MLREERVVVDGVEHVLSDGQAVEAAGSPAVLMVRVRDPRPQTDEALPDGSHKPFNTFVQKDKIVTTGASHSARRPRSAFTCTRPPCHGHARVHSVHRAPLQSHGALRVVPYRS